MTPPILQKMINHTFMKNSLVTMLVALLAIGDIDAQVINRAVLFSEEGTVDCGVMPRLDDATSYSIQFWMNPIEWKEGATLMQRGEDFAVKLGNPGSLVFITPGKSLNVSNEELGPEVWNQITLICNDGDAKVLINGKEAAQGKLSALKSHKESFKLGGDYSGRLDEIRIWDAPLDESMERFDYFTHNTLNKWCPMWNNLVAYYKMDQENCPYLVDYKAIETPDLGYDHHGILSRGVTRIESDNERMPYLINAAYIQTDRAMNWNVPSDQYLLSNQLIILGADAYSDGHIKERSPNNHQSLKDYFAGRGGVKVFISVLGSYRVREKFGNWREILGNPTSHMNFVNDLVALSKDYDGVELDLEWIEQPEMWKDFGILAQQIREKLPDNKEFRISLHNNYCDFPLENSNSVGGFTFQQYGPNYKNFSYNNFLENVEKFKKKFDSKKIMTSYSTTTSKGRDGSPVKMTGFDVLDNYQINDNDEDVYSDGSDVWSFMGPMQVYKRAKHTRENNLQGIFYWDMAGDQRNIDETTANKDSNIGEFNHAKYCSYGINANNDIIINDLQVNHYKGE